MPSPMDTINLIVAVPPGEADRYAEHLSRVDTLAFQIVDSFNGIHHTLATSDHRIDVLVVDNALGDTHTVIHELRQSYPRLLIILVDEMADFGMPGQADEFTNAPFRKEDLIGRIDKLIFERRQETLRSDSLPAVREISKNLRTAVGLGGKQQAAVDTVLDMEYDYVAYYENSEDDALKLQLKAQAGPKTITAIAPKKATPEDLMTWVAQNAQSRIASYGEEPNHPLVARGRLGAVACTPVAFDNVLHGVMVACRERPNSITQENVMMLELVSAQLAVVISTEKR